MKFAIKFRLTSAAARLGMLAIVFGFALSLFVPHHDALAQSGVLKTKFTIPAYCNQPQTECGWVQLVQLGTEILSFGVYIAILGATAVIVLAGWKILTAGGDEGAVKTGKKMLWASIVGIIVTMSAYMLVQFVLTKLGVISGIRLFI